ncbi:MFS transporter [Pannonibacter sp.]|uniref:MFS transporter n=1 Tax=Pannonibacter sp. TaxID=1906786 RepID=UPI003F706A61
MGSSQVTATPRSVQGYIDEAPLWADGTPVRAAVMTAMQWRIWGLAAAGKFFEGLVVFMTGVALPLMAREFNLDATGYGLVSAATLFGILIGATLLGGLADLFGRRRLFIIEMLLFIGFLALLAGAPNFVIVLIALFGLGVALGCDYPTAHLIISESISSEARGRMVLAAFAFQAVGALCGTALAYFVLTYHPQVDAWRWMYGLVILPATVVVIGRFFIPESPHWLLEQDRRQEAEQALQRLLKRDPAYPKATPLLGKAAELAHDVKKGSKVLLALFSNRKARRATILAAVPWFLQDLGTYGIGIFTPVILATALGHAPGHAANLADLLQDDLLAAEGAAMIDALLIVGILFAVLLADRFGRIRLQVVGFIGCAAGLFIATLSDNVSPSMQVPMIVAGFMIFNFMTNLGPNAQTYLIAGEVFPTRYRAVGAGFAASVAKIGAVLTAFLFPTLLATVGKDPLLFGLIAASLLGAWVTYAFRIETNGVSLETLDAEQDRT